MIYRVVLESLNQRFVYDFDDIEDAQEWVRQEISFDKNSDNPVGYSYCIYEVDYSDDTFSVVEMIANGKGLALVCNYYYELTDGEKVVYWSYYLHDILNFLRNYNA